MWEEKNTFDLIKVDHVTKFTNNTDFVCSIQLKPIPPKRKLNKIIFVRPRQFVFIEDDLDLKSTEITFEEL